MCMEKGVSFNFELNKVCSTSNTTPKKKYWFGFGTFEYTDEFIKYNGKKSCMHKNQLYLDFI